MPIRSALIGLGVTAVAAAALALSLGPGDPATASTVGATGMAVDLLVRVHVIVLTYDLRGLRRHLLRFAPSGIAAVAAAVPFTLVFEDARLIQVVASSTAACTVYVIAARALGTEHVEVLLCPLARAFAHRAQKSEEAS